MDSLERAIARLEQDVHHLRELQRTMQAPDQAGNLQTEPVAGALFTATRLLRARGENDAALSLLNEMKALPGYEGTISQTVDEVRQEIKDLHMVRRLKLDSFTVAAICRYLPSGGKDLLTASRVCRSWRQAILSAPLLWRNLTISSHDENPHLKADVFVTRAAGVGLRTIRIDVSIEYLDPPARPKRLLAWNTYNGESTFQQILHAIDVASVRLGSIHRLDAFQYFSGYSWHEYDMTYLARFLLRPYIQPRVVHIRSASYNPRRHRDPAWFGGWWWVPILPKFNPRLREVRVKGVANACFQWEPANACGPGSSEFPNSMLRRMKLVRLATNGDEGSDIVNVLNGLMSAEAIMAKHKTQESFAACTDELVLKSCLPGCVDATLLEVRLFIASWTPRFWSLTSAKSLDVNLPAIVLPALEELVVGADNFTFFRRIIAPNLCVLFVGAPVVFDEDEREKQALVNSLIAGLEHLGTSLRVLDLAKFEIQDPTLMHRLHELCPHLEVLRLGNNGRISENDIRAYITVKATSNVGCQRLKILEHAASSSESLRIWAQDHADYAPERFEPDLQVIEAIRRRLPSSFEDNVVFARLKETDEPSRWLQYRDSMHKMNVYDGDYYNRLRAREEQ